MKTLSELSIHSFIQEYNIKTEAGLPLNWTDHMFMFDVYSDLTPVQALMKGAQITASTCFSIKVPWVVKNVGMDAIYTLPTDTDRNTFVGGKVNRMIAQNPILQQWTKDKDSIEQKQIDGHLIHFRGTWAQKAAMMVPSDLNVYDEIDASKESVIEQYATRLQHSNFKWEWYLSHPSTEGYGVDRIWQKSDQKHWFVKCAHCNHRQYLSWPESICPERKIYQCKKCKKEIGDDERRRGEWVKKYRDREISGYWIPLLLSTRVSATEILKYHTDKTEEYFFNKVLGLPYVGRGNKLVLKALMANLTPEILVPQPGTRDIMGVDTGLKLDYVMGNEKGLYFHGDAENWAELDRHMKANKKLIAIVDAFGDLHGTRDFQARWPGRVFLCTLTGPKANTDEPTWNMEERMVNVDRNKYVQLVVDEFIAGRIPLQGTEDDWYDYWLDWNNLTRIKQVDALTGEFKGYKWVRSGRDHRALATVFWRVGMTRFGNGVGKVITGDAATIKTGKTLEEHQTSMPKFVFPADADD